MPYNNESVTPIGATIAEGPAPFSIIQKDDGAGQLKLRGRWHLPGDVSSERDGSEVLPWQPGRIRADNHWEIDLGQINSGGLYRVETCLQYGNGEPGMVGTLRGDNIHHLGVGDLWVIAGQSNAAGYGREPVDDPPELGVHLLRLSGRWDIASHPFQDAKDILHLENKDNGMVGHSPALAFGRLLKQELGFPIGLIQAARGGSGLSEWHPEQDGVLSRNMLDLIERAGGTVRGIVWYQGESDAKPIKASTIFKRFRDTVAHWRSKLGEPSLPILTVQLNRWVDPASKEAHEAAWSSLRESQRRAALEIPNVFVTSSLDGDLSDQIHNSSKANIRLGERLARQALDHVYGHTNACDCPDLDSAAFIGNSRNEIKLVFAHATEFHPHRDPGGIFRLETTSGDILPHRVRSIEGNKVLLSIEDAPPGELLVSGAWGKNPFPEVLVESTTGLPMLVFHKVPVSPEIL